jgi:hypothetical protein
MLKVIGKRLSMFLLANLENCVTNFQGPAVSYNCIGKGRRMTERKRTAAKNSRKLQQTRSWKTDALWEHQVTIYCSRYVTDCSKAKGATFMHNRKSDNHKIFTAEEETEVSNCLIMSEKLHRGLIRVQTHKLIHDFTKRNLFHIGRNVTLQDIGRLCTFCKHNAQLAMSELEPVQSPDLSPLTQPRL